MNQSIQAVYKNGMFRPLSPLNLPEDSVVEIDVRDVVENAERESAVEEKIRAFQEWMDDLEPNTPSLTDEQISRESIYEERIRRQS